jgi:hypothetical protein
MTKRGKIEADTRTLMQGAKHAITDVFDAIAELVTNADDRYQILNVSGRIEIEVERALASRSRRCPTQFARIPP